ncbi:MAG: PAS domain-containing protein [Parvularculaceae bacterium]
MSATAEPISQIDGAPSPAAGAVIAQLSLALADTPDNSFIMKYAHAASRALGADYFIISRLNPYSNLMRSLAFIVDGEEAANITYSLDGTPCARAIDDNCCIYPDMVADKFPQDRFLTEYGIAGYAGVPLRNAGGETLGVSLVLTRQPIADPDTARSVLEHFARRAAAAIEATEMLERYGWAIAEATDGVWDWDVVTGGTSISPSIQALLGCFRGAGPYDLTQIENAIHPEDRSAHAAALRNHLNNGAPFDVRIRLKNRSGVYRWFRSRGKAVRNADGRPVRMIGSFDDIHDLVIEARRDRLRA